MEARRTSPTKKRKTGSGVRNDTGPEQYEISSIGIQIETLRCTRCKRIPDTEIFHCVPEPPDAYQHLVCEACKHLDNVCPVKLCFGTLARVKILEKVMDDIRFKCPWTQYGCLEENLARNELTAHQKDCAMNPNFLNCSDLFGSKCDYKFSTVYDNDDNKIKEMKEHLLFHNGDLVTVKANYGDHKEEKFHIGETNKKIYLTGVFDWTKYNSAEILEGKLVGTHIGTFMAIWLVDTEENEMRTMSRYFVSLAGDYLSKTKVEVQLTLQSQPKINAGIPKKCLPNLKWATGVLNTREFKEILVMSQQERFLKNYSIPVSHLQKYFVNANGELTIKMFPTLIN